MLVMKFGGSSVGTGERIAGVAELVESRLSEEPFVVVSAMGGVTDVLLSLSRAAREGDRPGVAAALESLGRTHNAAVDALGLEGGTAGALREEISRELARLEGLATGVALLGAALHDAGVLVEAIEIWTDVDGILTADPQGASETNLTFVVQASDAPEAVRRLHRELFEKEAA